MFKELIKVLPRELAVKGRVVVGVSELAMMEVLADGERRVGDVALEARVTPQNLTGLLDKMIDMGLMQRRNCEMDRRVVWACLTDAGFALWRDVQEAMKRKGGAR